MPPKSEPTRYLNNSSQLKMPLVTLRCHTDAPICHSSDYVDEARAEQIQGSHGTTIQLSAPAVSTGSGSGREVLRTV